MISALATVEERAGMSFLRWLESKQRGKLTDYPAGGPGCHQWKVALKSRILVAMHKVRLATVVGELAEVLPQAARQLPRTGFQSTLRVSGSSFAKLLELTRRIKWRIDELSLSWAVQEDHLVPNPNVPNVMMSTRCTELFHSETPVSLVTAFECAQRVDDGHEAVVVLAGQRLVIATPMPNDEFCEWIISTGAVTDGDGMWIAPEGNIAIAHRDGDAPTVSIITIGDYSALKAFVNARLPQRRLWFLGWMTEKRNRIIGHSDRPERGSDLLERFGF